jgi:cytochrome b
MGAGDHMTEERMRSIKLWDVPTRVFHWSLVTAVLFAYFTSAGRPHGLTYALHVGSGYAVALLLVFRFIWGFIGSETARFEAFVRAWGAVKAHLQSLLRLSPLRSFGHNPTGGWVIILMLANLLLIVVTGLMVQGKPGGSGPLTWVLPTSLIAPVGAVHQLLGNAILFIAGFHIAGVLVESLLMRENLVRAMITGRSHDERPEARDARMAPLWRAAVIVLIAAFLGGYMAGVTHFPPSSANVVHKASWRIFDEGSGGFNAIPLVL